MCPTAVVFALCPVSQKIMNCKWYSEFNKSEHLEISYKILFSEGEKKLNDEFEEMEDEE